jgi:hypothetical protein
MNTPPTRFDYIGRWLVEHYQLGELDRSHIVQAVFVKPQRIREQELRRAASGLATEVLRGKLPLPRMQRYAGPFICVLGFALTVSSIIFHFIFHGWQGQIVIGVMLIVLGGVVSVWAPKQMRRNVDQALRLNADNEN